MARTLKKKPTNEVSNACEAYQLACGGVCEVSQFLRQHPPAAEWMTKRVAASPWQAHQVQTHHIFGRSSRPESNWFCSLASVYEVCHFYGHLVAPHHLEICSIMAKRGRQLTIDALAEVYGPKADSEDRLPWHPLAMASAACNDSLAGRIEGILLPKLVGTVFEKMALELLEVLA